MTSFKFTSREVIGVLKARITTLAAQLTKERKMSTAAIEHLTTHVTEYRLQAQRLRNELNEKNGIIEQLNQRQMQSIEQVSNMTLATRLSEQLAACGVNLDHYRDALHAVHPATIGADLEELFNQPRGQRAFTAHEICQVFSVKAEDIVRLGKSLVPPQPSMSHVAVGAIDSAAMSGARYGEFVDVKGFAPASIPAPGPHGYEHRAGYIPRECAMGSTKQMTVLHTDDVSQHHIDSGDVVPVVVTVLR